jgi:hypothetical protein
LEVAVVAATGAAADAADEGVFFQIKPRKLVLREFMEMTPSSASSAAEIGY